MAGLVDVPEHPTYAEDVAPLLYENCVMCHRSSGIGPFPLLTYEDAKLRADLIVFMTSERTMPPWLPADMELGFANARGLHESGIELLRRWAADGAPSGDLSLAPPPPEFSGGWALGEPDLVLTMSEAFTVRGGTPEEFRNFVVPSNLGRSRYVRAVELRPGNTRVVHHATVRVDTTDSSRLEDARDPTLGFDEMFTVSEARPPGGFFLGWTPGLIPRENPPGMAWELTPGTDFIIQLHIRPVAEDEDVQSEVAIYFTDTPPTREPIIVRLGSQTMDIAPGDGNYRVEDSFRLPVDVEALGVYPHAHYLGQEMVVWAELPGGERVDLLLIDDWDFNWQDVYHYEAPVALPRGTGLFMRFVYDNSAENPQNPSQPPQRVIYGPSSMDEMAELWLQVVPRNANDLATLGAELQRKQVVDRIEGWRHMLTIDQNDPHSNLGLGNMHQALGEFSEARARYEQALIREPDHPQARYNLGLVLEAMGDTTGAIREFRAAIQSFPLYPDALNNLGVALARRGRPQQAEAEFRRAVAADSLHPDAQNNLGNMLRTRGALEEAVDRYDIAIRVRPASPLAHLNRALALVDLGRSDEAVDGVRAGLPYFNQDPQPLMTVAWALATVPEAPRRRGNDAVEMADAANQLTGGQHPIVLDVLAVSLGAAGRFTEAVQVAERALALARAEDNAAWVSRIQAHLERLQSRGVWVERR